MLDQFTAAANGDCAWFRDHDSTQTLPDLLEPSKGKLRLTVHEYAAKNNQLDVLKWLFEECSQDLRAHVPQFAVLREAFSYGHLDIVKYIFEDEKVNTVLQNDENSGHMMEYITYMKEGEVSLKYLLEDCPLCARYREHLQTEDGQELLQSVSDRGRTDILILFAKNGAKITPEIAESASSDMLNEIYDVQKVLHEIDSISLESMIRIIKDTTLYPAAKAGAFRCDTDIPSAPQSTSPRR